MRKMDGQTVPIGVSEALKDTRETSGRVVLKPGHFITSGTLS